MKDMGMKLNKIANMDCYEYIDMIKDKSIFTNVTGFQCHPL